MPNPIAAILAVLLTASAPAPQQGQGAKDALPKAPQSQPVAAPAATKAETASRNSDQGGEAASKAAESKDPAKAADAAFSSGKSKKPADTAAPKAKAAARSPSPAVIGKNTPLAKEVEQIIQGTPLAEGRLSVEVISLDTGKVVYGRNASDLLNPASNAKLFTSAAALAILGPGFRFETEFIFDGDPHKPAPVPKTPKERRAARQNLYVRGGGDPTLTNEELWSIASELYDRGLRTITGDIVLDESFFDDDMVGAGFDQEESDRAYMAPPASLTLNWNSVGVHVWPGTRYGARAFVAVDPESDYFTLDNKAVTRGRKAVRRLVVSTIPSEDGKSDRVLVSGRLPVGSGEIHAWRKVSDPGMYFGHTLKRFLAMRGIAVKGVVRKGPAPARGTTGPVTLAVHRSRTLANVLRHVNKNSSNIVAEALVKTLGAKVYGQPGSWKNGLYAIERYLDVEVGMKPGTYVMKNGSGLNDVNRFSPHQVNQLLLAMWRRFPTAPEFMSSLGIAGQDGTVQFRMTDTPAAGRLRAKTGTLENVSALSGYVQNVGGEKLAFSIVANDFPGRAGKIVPLLDAIGAAIAGQGNPKAKSAAHANLASALTPLDRLGKEIAANIALVAAKDPRSAQDLFARISLERDPAMKALLADALVQITPDSADVARAFMRHFDAGEDVLGRLSKAADAASLPPPLIQSLAQLATDGNPEALAGLVGIAARDDVSATVLKEATESLVEVSFIVPGSVFNALKSMEDASARSRAVARLFQGIALAEKLAATPEPEDPATAAAAKATKGKDDKAALEPPPPHPFPALAERRLKDGKTRLPADFANALREALSGYKPASADEAATPASPSADGASKPEVANAAPSSPATSKEADASPAATDAKPESKPTSKPDSGDSGASVTSPADSTEGAKAKATATDVPAASASIDAAAPGTASAGEASPPASKQPPAPSGKTANPSAAASQTAPSAKDVGSSSKASSAPSAAPAEKTSAGASAQPNSPEGADASGKGSVKSPPDSPSAAPAPSATDATVTSSPEGASPKKGDAPASPAPADKKAAAPAPPSEDVGQAEKASPAKSPSPPEAAPAKKPANPPSALPSTP